VRDCCHIYLGKWAWRCGRLFRAASRRDTDAASAPWQRRVTSRWRQSHMTTTTSICRCCQLVPMTAVTEELSTHHDSIAAAAVAAAAVGLQHAVYQRLRMRRRGSALTAHTDYVTIRAVPLMDVLGRFVHWRGVKWTECAMRKCFFIGSFL